MDDRNELVGSDAFVRRTAADWDNYLRDKLIELRQLLDEAGEVLSPDIVNK